MTPKLQPAIPEEIRPYVDQAAEAVSMAKEWWDSFTPTSVAGLIVGAILLIIAISLIKRILRFLSSGQGPGSKNYRREARHYQRQGHSLRAGELFEMAGDDDEAAEMYRQAEAYRNLGHLYEKKKNWMGAAGAYEAGREYDKAAQMYQRAGQYNKAAEVLLTGKKESSAAEMFELAGNFQEAARLYERSTYFQKAAACYERTGQLSKAAELYEKHYLQEKVRYDHPGLGSDISKKSQLSTFAQQSGRLYLKAGDAAKAAKIFMLGGQTKEAADAFWALKDYAKAADLYHTAKQYTKAAEVYQQMGQPQKAFQVMAEMYLEARNYLDAAQLYEKAQDFIQAGDLYEKAGDLRKAAEMFQKGSDFSRANDLFQTAGDALSAARALESGKRHREAAQEYIKLGDYERAALLLEEAGDFYEAGMIFHRLGRTEDTIAFLQKVDPQSEHYFEASLILGKMFMERGMLDTAKERYKKLLSRKEISSNPEPLYNLGLIYEQNREYSNALLLYEKIISEDYNYQDVQERLRITKEAAQKEALQAPNRRSGETSGPRGRYRILDKVGQGGMGVVYRAEDTLLNRIVAYKVLPPSVRDNKAMLENFIQEARVAAGINHPNIVTIYDTGTEGDEPYIIMEFVDGITLKGLLERATTIPAKDIVEIAKQVCRGLHYAHAKNVIHRDIKPANIMISQEKVVKIMDFGLAKLMNSAVQEGTGVKGTPLYMSPEQIKNQRVDHRTDIYSLGCTLYRMATGRPPFMEGDVYYHHIHTPPVPPRTHNSEVPESMNKLILKCMEKDPENRFQTAKEIITTLEGG